ncbi:hypothetical protein LCI18_014441 [Fusarium solani-melongenae]|uniref:Uncharacterized protein n=1 Tax=Fusarium solani subsp. cucurbitae TaxID=2747967 RepID=A0ACD3ZRP2_FUSSC|nr:hypothetical protein LCI18_014441 [Fusarium solani-melongenae]
MDPSGSANLSIRQSKPPIKKRPAKLFHKKSRTGCQRCRARRVKCDEAKPICSNCTRLELDCVYDRAKSPSSQASGGSTRPFLADERIVDPPESEARRKLEQRLFYQYMTDTGPSTSMDDIAYEFWVTSLCKRALTSDSILYAMFMVVCLHNEHRSKYTDEEAAETCRTYLNMALREHHKDIENMSLENVDSICLVSSMLRLYGFVKIQQRVLDPYVPPINWLRISGSSTAVFRKAWDLIKNKPDSVAYKMIDAVSDYLDDNKNEELRRNLMHLIRREEAHELEESWDAEIEAAYGGAVSFIGGIWKSMNQREPAATVGRRVVVFPMMIHKRFVDLVEEQRPRALVILANYFALMAMLRSFWWIGDSGPRELQAIIEVVPEEWQGLLRWPKQVLEEQVVFTDDD